MPRHLHLTQVQVTQYLKSDTQHTDTSLKETGHLSYPKIIQLADVLPDYVCYTANGDIVPPSLTQRVPINIMLDRSRRPHSG